MSKRGVFNQKLQEAKGYFWNMDISLVKTENFDGRPDKVLFLSAMLKNHDALDQTYILTIIEGLYRTLHFSIQRALH